MALGLIAHGLNNTAFKPLGITWVGAQYLAQVQAVLIAQTEQQTPLGGKAHPVATAAKVVGHRRDKAYFRLAAGHGGIAGWSAGSLCTIQQVKFLIQLLANLRTGNLGVAALVGGNLPQRHLLDKGDIHTVIHRKARQI